MLLPTTANESTGIGRTVSPRSNVTPPSWPPTASPPARLKYFSVAPMAT